MGEREFKFTGTASFMGESFEIGRFTRDLFSLKDLWDCVMHETLGLQFAVGDKYHQQVPIPWNGGLREIQTDSDLMDVLALFEQNNVNKIHFNVENISVNVVMPSDSDDQSSNNDRDVDDGNAAGEEHNDGPRVLDVEDDDNELDGLSDVNEDNISKEVVLENGSGSEGEIDQPNRGTTFTLGEDGRIKLEVGQLFKNATHFRQILLEYSIQEGFRLKRIRNERKRITNGCKAEGCQWRVHGSPTYDGITYMLKTLRPKHDCLSVVKNKDITARWLGKRFETLIKDNPDMNIRVLASIVLRNIGVYVPDHTLYRAKRFALKIGDKDHKESYNKLYRYGGIIIERNPGSYAKLSTISYDPNLNVPVHFHRFYLSFYAQKKGYLDGCRPFIGLDGCHLKGPYEGILLCAVAIDANSGVFPIALGVVEIESLDSWTWFIQLLYEHVGMHEQRKVCFMSDRQKGIIPALDAIWPNHHTRFCGRHILQNLMSTFKVEYLRELFWPAARSSNLTDFVKAMAEIKEISEPAHQYLLKIPLEYWTVHAFDTITKTDHNTNNVVEAFNGWLNKYRAQPLLTMMENVRRKFMKRMQDRYEAAMSWEGNIPPKINKLLQKTQQKGRYLDPLRCDQWEFEVVDGTRQFVVKLDDQTCQCGIWAVSGIPCKHAMACITRMRQNVEDYVHEYLKKPAYLKTYSNAIHAIPDESLWPEVEHGTVLPPLKRRRSGRPRLSRRRGVTEPARVKRSMGFRCSKCQEVGHNSRTCKAPVQGSRTEPISSSTTPATSKEGNSNKRTKYQSSTVGASASTSVPTSTTTHSASIAANVATTNASSRITRVLWFSSSQEGTSSQGHAGNAHLTSQNLMLNAPQQPQSSQGTQGGTQRARNWTTID